VHIFVKCRTFSGEREEGRRRGKGGTQCPLSNAAKGLGALSIPHRASASLTAS